MRLRLTVQRNALPAANILWNVPDTNSNAAYTITRLLEDVNHIMPLEAENWGLEDYAVEVGGFECLHFTPVTQALKEDDHVCIRPLMTAEVRARTLTGRLQISDGGQHLVDGVPFGRPYLRAPHRPAVRIPPRKRQRADQQEADEVREARDLMNALLEGTVDGPVQQQIEAAPDAAGALQAHERQRLDPQHEARIRDTMDSVLAALGDPSSRSPNGLGDQSSSSRPLAGPATQRPLTKRQRRESREREEDMAMAQSLLQLLGPPDQAVSENAQLAPQETARRRPKIHTGRKSKRHVHFKQPIAEELGASEEDDDDDDDDDDFAPGGNDQDLDMDDDTSESDSDFDSEDSSSGSGSLRSGLDSDSSSDSDSDSDSDASSPPDVLSSKDGSKAATSLAAIPSSSDNIPPGKGRQATKLRNSRRTRTNRLRHLKGKGLLKMDATLAELQAYEDAKTSGGSEEASSAQPFSTASGKRKRIEDGDATPGAQSEEKNELEKRKQELMARLSDSSNGTLQEDTSASSVADVAAPEEPTPEKIYEEEPAKKDTPTRRMRPDTSAISRILARQTARPAKKAKTKPLEDGPPEPEGASDPNFWKSRINLSAFECWDEEYELSAPPYPFVQHWDKETSKLMREKKHKGKKKSNKSGPAPELQQPGDEEDKILLNYDDAPTEQSPDVEINAAIEDQLRQDVATATQEKDLPLLPEDLSTLPALTSADIKAGAIIACKFFAVNPITITPEISDYKTAIVEKEGDSGNGAGTIQLKIAARDLPQREKKFDKNGNRIYAAGDAFLMEDEEEEEGLWEGQFGELLEAKLLRAAEA